MEGTRLLWLQQQNFVFWSDSTEVKLWNLRLLKWGLDAIFWRLCKQVVNASRRFVYIAIIEVIKCFLLWSSQFHCRLGETFVSFSFAICLILCLCAETRRRLSLLLIELLIIILLVFKCLSNFFLIRLRKWFCAIYHINLLLLLLGLFWFLRTRYVILIDRNAFILISLYKILCYNTVTTARVIQTTSLRRWRLRRIPPEWISMDDHSTILTFTDVYRLHYGRFSIRR